MRLALAERHLHTSLDRELDGPRRSLAKLLVGWLSVLPLWGCFPGGQHTRVMPTPADYSLASHSRQGLVVMSMKMTRYLPSCSILGSVLAFEGKDEKFMFNVTDVGDGSNIPGFGKPFIVALPAGRYLVTFVCNDSHTGLFQTISPQARFDVEAGKTRCVGSLILDVQDVFSLGDQKYESRWHVEDDCERLRSQLGAPYGGVVSGMVVTPALL
jgi:hypothetical protein